MPTGYTCDIENGISFEKFVLNCATAFDIRARDGDNRLLPVEPSDYYKRQAGETEQELAVLLAMDEEAYYQKARLAQEEDIEYQKERQQKNQQLRAKYESMLKKVKEWTVPTKEHESLKNFMISQIQESIKFDCHEWEKSSEKPLTKARAKELKEDEIAMLRQQIEKYNMEYQEEVQRAKRQTAWIADLRDSLAKTK